MGILEAIREAFEEPIDGRLEDGGDEEWKARINNVNQFIKENAQAWGYRGIDPDQDWTRTAEVLLGAAGITRHFPTVDPLTGGAHFFNAQIRVRWIETKADGSVLVETADEFDKGTRILLAPDQMRENA